MCPEKGSFQVILALPRPEKDVCVDGMETVAVTERQMGKVEVAELKIMRWTLGVTRKDKIRNDHENCKAGRQTSECKATLV